MTALEVGAKYSCFEDFQAALVKFSRDTNSIYTVFNSKSIEAENRGRLPDKQYPVCLKYRFIKYTCKHYGVNRSKSKGLRPNQSSFKIGCPAFIYLSVQKNELVVEKMEAKHSHVCDPDIINYYPERRGLTPSSKNQSINFTDEEESELVKSVREDVLDLLRLHVDRRRIRNYVRLRTNRVLSAVDLANFAKQMQGQDKELSEDRSYQLLDMLTALESKENEPARVLEDLVKKEKYRSLKRKIAHVKLEGATPGATESGNDNVQEHGYSNRTNQMWWNLKDNDEPGPLPAKREMTIDSQGIEWDSHTLEEMVKTINPNEEGPVLVHMNNYDGVMVVEIQNGQGAVTQLEGTVVEVEDDLPGDVSKHLSDSATEDISELENEEEEPAHKSTPKKPGPLSKTKKIIQFRKRDKVSQPTSPTKGDPKTLIDIAMESAGCNPKLEREQDTPSKDLMDNQSDAESDHGDVFVDCGGGDDFNDEGDEGYSGPVLRESKRARLEAETEMLKVKTSKLKLQVKYLKNELSKQDLEKEKLRLEIVLLKARIGMNEMH